MAMADGAPGTRDWGAILIWAFFGLAVAVLLASGVFVITYKGSTSPGSASSLRAPPSAPPGASAGTSPSGGAATCSPNGTALQETAKGIAYQSTCLAAPANQAFTIAFDNRDSGILHDIHIFTDPSAAHSLFTGAIVTGPASVNYSVGPLPPARTSSTATSI